MKNISRTTFLLMTVLIASHNAIEPIKLPTKKTVYIIVGSILAVTGIACGIHILYKIMNKRPVELNAYSAEFYNEHLPKKIPSITKKQQIILDTLESFLPKYVEYREKLKEDPSCTGELKLRHEWGESYYHEPRTPNKIYFLNEECHTLVELEACKITCTENPDPSTARACARLGELLESVGDAPAGYRQMPAADGDVVRIPYWKDQYLSPLAKYRPRNNI